MDIPVILGKLKANRWDLTVRRLEIIFETFKKEGLAFVWEVAGREYVHWTGSERVGRLPRLSRRSNKYEKRLAPPLPEKAYMKYLQRFGETLFASGADAFRNQARATDRATDRVKEKNTAQASPALLGFALFWDAYPRKVAKQEAAKVWARLLPDEMLTIAINAGVKAWDQSDQWNTERPKLIPYPTKFLKRRQWEDGPPATDRKESAVGRGPQPAGEAHPLPAPARKVLAERQRLDNISDLERYLAEGQGNPSLRGKCRKRLEELRAKPPVNP